MIVQDLSTADTLRFQNPGVYVQGLAADGTPVQIGGTPTKPSTAASSPTRFANLGANATLNVKATSGNVFSLYCHNANAASRYIQLHNTATTPADQDVPLYSFLVPTLGQTIIGEDFFSTAGANFSTGIAFAFSTTKATYTAGTNTDQNTVIHYK